jgi:hypothetical protein
MTSLLDLDPGMLFLAARFEMDQNIQRSAHRSEMPGPLVPVGRVDERCRTSSEPSIPT